MKPSRKMCSNRFSTCARIRWWRPSWPRARSRFTAGCMTSSPAIFAAAGGTASSSRISMTIMRRRLLGLLRPKFGVWVEWGYLPSGKKELASLRHLFFLREGSPTPPFLTLGQYPLSGQYGPEVVLVGVFYYRLYNLAWLQVGFTVEVNHAVDFRGVGLGAADGAFFVYFVNQHINGLADLGLQASG